MYSTARSPAITYSTQTAPPRTAHKKVLSREFMYRTVVNLYCVAVMLGLCGLLSLSGEGTSCDLQGENCVPTAGLNFEYVALWFGLAAIPAVVAFLLNRKWHVFARA